MNTFNLQEYQRQLNEFPNISFEEYQQISDEKVRQDIASKNKIIQTDTYNRTMTHIKWERAKKIETFVFSMRKAPEDRFIVVDWIRKALKKMLSFPITQWELEFAKDFYKDQEKRGGVGYFNPEMRQEVIDNWGYLPLTIKAVADGTALKAKEPAMVVTWPAELAAIFEPDFIRPFYKSKVATDAHRLEEIMQDDHASFATKVCEQGKRASINEESHLDAVASLIVGGGLQRTSNDSAALVYPQVLSGWTTAHRFYASYPTEDEAMKDAVEKTDKIALLTDLVNTERGVEKVLDIKEKYRNSERIIFPRLDSGNTKQATLDTLSKQEKRWMRDSLQDKVSVSEWISSEKAIKELEIAVKEIGFGTEFLAYGIGGLLVAKDKTRDSVSAAYKLTNTEEGPTGKLSDDIGKESIPGILNIEIRDGVRYLVQEDEEQQGERLLHPVYENGRLLYDLNDIKAIDDARNQLLKTIQRVDFPTQESDLTYQIHLQVRENLLSNLQLVEEMELV